jgi:hypothetical protein
MELHLKISYESEKSEHLGWWQDIAESANWWFPFEGFCFVSERPIRCAIDEQRRLHHESKAAMEFRDGWKVYAYHGVTVPGQVIEAPETITVKQIKVEANAEVRRCMIERMGWERFCAEAQMRVIHTDTLTARFPSLPVSETVHADMRAVTRYRKGTEVAELLEADEFRDFEDRPLKFVRVTDPSTGEKYLIRVWPENRRAYEAIAQTFGMTEEQYRESVHSHS